MALATEFIYSSKPSTSNEEKNFTRYTSVTWLTWNCITCETSSCFVYFFVSQRFDFVTKSCIFRNCCCCCCSVFVSRGGVSSIYQAEVFKWNCSVSVSVCVYKWHTNGARTTDIEALQLQEVNKRFVFRRFKVEPHLKICWHKRHTPSNWFSPIFFVISAVLCYSSICIYCILEMRILSSHLVAGDFFYDDVVGMHAAIFLIYTGKNKKFILMNTQNTAMSLLGFVFFAGAQLFSPYLVVGLHFLEFRLQLFSDFYIRTTLKLLTRNGKLWPSSEKFHWNEEFEEKLLHTLQCGVLLFHGHKNKLISANRSFPCKFLDDFSLLSELFHLE